MQSSDNPHSYLVPLTIAPAFLTGALYLCLSRIIIVYGQEISRFSPRTYAITFMTSDFISLVLQGGGGGLAATANDKAGSDAGRAIMVAGVVFQVVSLLVFTGLWVEFTIRLCGTRESAREARFTDLRATKRFAWFQYAFGAAIVLIFIRSVYRVAELQQGFHGPIANDEISFMILEPPMIVLAVLAMTIFHPGSAFGGQWNNAGWSVKRSRKTAFSKIDTSVEDIPLQPGYRV